LPESDIRLPPRDIPVPTSVSPEARAVMATRLPTPGPARPALDDVEAWHQQIDEHTAEMKRMIGGRADVLPFERRTLLLGEFEVYIIVPDGQKEQDGPAVLEIHGGGFINLGGPLCGILATQAALIFGTVVWAVDYRRPPDHPYPAPLDDCVNAYRTLLEARSPSEILIVGGSAGGNLAAALCLRAQDEGLPAPAGVILRTPAVDLTDSGDSLWTNRGLDNVIFAAEPVVNRLYAGEHDLGDPYISPLFGNLARFPPTLLTTGTRDLFLSNTARMHRALRSAGVTAELHVMEAAGHGGFFGAAPEDREIEAEMRGFAQRCWQQHPSIS
jgi:epsilon-lactone hydrolase